MKQFFEKIFHRQSDGPEFLTTQGINYRLENMIKEAQESIFLVSPYVRINPRLKELLLAQRRKGTNITVVFRENFIDKNIATTIFCRNNLHAKCYMTESAAIISSLNIFDFSQVNNDEMGIYILRAQSPSLYDDVAKEVRRLCSDFSHKTINSTKKNLPSARTELTLKKGCSYTVPEVKTLFDFIDDYPGGIKLTHDGDIVLFLKNNSKYSNEERDGIIYFQGQNTGGDEQKLIYGNKALYDCYTNKTGRIFLFKDGVFHGEQTICQKPYQKNSKWCFPLRQC